MELVPERDWTRNGLTDCRRYRTLVKRFRSNLGKLYGFTTKEPFDAERQQALAMCLLVGDHLLVTWQDYLKAYPRLAAHIISESLGYASPCVAGRILMDSVNTGRNWCEWVQACYSGDAKAVVRLAFRHRHLHDNGFMSYIDRARSLVREANAHRGHAPGTDFGSWF